jgi:hypothetical protein
MNHPNPYALSGPLSVALAMVVLLAVVGATTVRRGYRRTVARTKIAARTGRVLARVATTATVITLLQWVLLVASASPWVWGLALGLPAVVAGSAVHPLLTVTTITHTRLTGRTRARR